MKIYFSRTMIFLGVISLVMGSMTSLGMNLSYADNLEIIGTDIGLEVDPSGTKLFDLTNLNPGDTKEAKIDIKNNYTSPFEVFMRTERTSPQPIEGDLFEQLILTIFLDDIEIYSGPMKDYATSNISLGNFSSNSKKELRAIVHLPGPETGNEFQGKTLEVKWYFIAELKEKPIDPIDPTEPTRPQQPGEVEIIEGEIPKGLPEAEVETIEEIPKTVPEAEEIIVEIIEEEIPKGAPEIEEIEEIVEVVAEDITKAGPKLPKTGEIALLKYYLFGIILISLGIGTSVKKKDLE